MKNFITTKTISFLLIFLTFPKFYAQNATFDSLLNEINKIAIYNKTKSFEMLDNLYQMAYQDSDSSLLIAHCIYTETLLKRRQRIVDSALTHRIRCRFSEKYLPPLEAALLQAAWGTNLISEGEYADAFYANLQALETFKQLKQNHFTAKTFNCLANICRNINLPNLAEYYHAEAITYLTSDFHGYYFTKLSSFLILSYNSKKTAIDSLLCLKETIEKNNLKELLPILYLNLGSFYLDTLPEKALTYFNKMLATDFDNPSMIGTLYANMGSYYSGKKEFLKALKYFKDAQKIMEKNNDFFNLSPLYNDISIIFEQLNQYDSALHYSRKNQEVTFQTRANVAAIETYQKYITTFLEATENELIIADQTIKLKSKQFVIIIIVSTFIVLLILLFLLLAHQQKLRKASENRELSAKLEHEKKVQQYEKKQRKLEKEKQEERLDAKTREVTSYSILVSNNNRILKQIKELNRHIYDGEENPVHTAKKIDEVIQNNLNIDGEWKNFIMHFEEVHPHFFEKLKQCCDDLTEENLKMCAYIKMRMTTKQIAQLLHVIPRSIIINRYRLKKKLQLEDTEDLNTFIENL